MYYTFVCKKCEKDIELSIPITQYQPDGHVCPICGEPIERKIEDMICGGFKAKDGFYCNTEVKGR